MRYEVYGAGVSADYAGHIPVQGGNSQQQSKFIYTFTQARYGFVQTKLFQNSKQVRFFIEAVFLVTIVALSNDRYFPLFLRSGIFIGNTTETFTCAGGNFAVLENDAGRISSDNNVCCLGSTSRRAELGGRDFELVPALPDHVVASVHQQPSHVLPREQSGVETAKQHGEQVST